MFFIDNVQYTKETTITFIYTYQRIPIDLFIQLISRETERERERENRDWLNHETIYTYNIGISCRCRFIICTSTE